MKSTAMQGEWVLYVGKNNEIISTYKSHLAAKKAMNKLSSKSDYDSIGIGYKGGASSEKYYAKGGTTTGFNYTIGGL
jgi:hypothetical protein